jgi:hypothetical protein
MRPKLKLGDSILVKKKNSTAHWGTFLKYEAGRIEYRPSQKVHIDYCAFRDILDAKSSVGKSLMN